MIKKMGLGLVLQLMNIHANMKMEAITKKERGL